MSARFGIGLLSVGVIVALALGWLFGSASSLPSAPKADGGSSSQPVTQEALARELSALRSQLKVESSARRKLANQLAQLRLDLETSGALVLDVEGRLRPVWDGDLSAAADEEEADPLLEQGEDDEQEEVADAASVEDPASGKTGFRQRCADCLGPPSPGGRGIKGALGGILARPPLHGRPGETRGLALQARATGARRRFLKENCWTSWARKVSIGFSTPAVDPTASSFEMCCKVPRVIERACDLETRSFVTTTARFTTRASSRPRRRAGS